MKSHDFYQLQYPWMKFINTLKGCFSIFFHNSIISTLHPLTSYFQEIYCSQKSLLCLDPGVEGTASTITCAKYLTLCNLPYCTVIVHLTAVLIWKEKSGTFFFSLSVLIHQVIYNKKHQTLCDCERSKLHTNYRQNKYNVLVSKICRMLIFLFIFSNKLQ